VNRDVLRLAVKVFVDQTDRDMLAALSLPLHPDNIPPPQLEESIKVTSRLSAYPSILIILYTGTTTSARGG
jgi:hypothetical protein